MGVPYRRVAQINIFVRSKQFKITIQLTGRRDSLQVPAHHDFAYEERVFIELYKQPKTSQ
jgi:hypothetical protein